MMNYKPPPASLEYNQKRLIDIIRIGHDTLDNTHKILQEAIQGIYDFQAVPSSDEIGKVYQYELENQKVYNKHEVVIGSVMGVFEQVVNDSKAKLFSLEMQIPTGTQLDMPPPPIVPDKGESNIKDTRSIFQKLKGTPQTKRIITPDDPYQDGLAHLKRLMGKLIRFEIFQEYQTYGVDRAIDARFETMKYYLRFHRTRFRVEVATPILYVHRQYIDLIKEREKQGAIRMGIKLGDDLWSGRNDWQQGSPPS